MNLILLTSFFIPYYSAICSLLISGLAIPIIIKIAKKRQFYDQPNERKLHTSPIPTLGGIGIFFGFFVSVSFWIQSYAFQLENWSYLSFSMIVLFIVGLIDDLKEVSANKKLIFQVLIATLTVLGGTRLVSFHDFMGIGELPLFLQYGLSILIIVGLINAYNLIDGMDGLAAGIGLINSLAFSAIFILKGEMFLATLSLSFGGSLFAFLIYNFNPAKIFMGDTGSLIIGFMMAVFAFNALSFGQNDSISYLEPNQLMVIVFAILMLPVFDSLRVYYQRIRKGGSPFQADQTHIHHLLHLSGLEVKTVVIIIYLANFVFIAVSFLISTLSAELGVLMLLIMSIGSYKAFTILLKPFESDSDNLKPKLMLKSKLNSNELKEDMGRNEKVLMKKAVE